ncbi:sugar transporter SWEET1 isoform X2 [Anas platyrhynchos]|uniref:sugar transporter SWEET1 isoform X2 n=1 Tax=Anas platyrhynchos TaxID=8839 RepID=UPI003AF2DD78
MELQPVLAAACLLFTMGMFCSGLFDLCRIITAKSVDNIQLLRFLAIKANNLCWLGYGCQKPDWMLIIINSIGATLQSLYILVYFYYSPAKRQVLLRVLTFLALLAAAYGYFFYFTDKDTLRSRVGLFCSSLTIMMYASPLNDLAKVIRSRSTRCLSFPLAVTTFLASSCWTLYGQLVKDNYITVPNVPGIVTSVVQLWLFWRYAPGRDNPHRPLHV